MEEAEYGRPQGESEKGSGDILAERDLLQRFLFSFLMQSPRP